MCWSQLKVLSFKLTVVRKDSNVEYSKTIAIEPFLDIVYENIYVIYPQESNCSIKKCSINNQLVYVMYAIDSNLLIINM